MLATARENLSGTKTYTTDPQTAEYRSDEELTKIQSAIEKKAEEMANDFLDELDAKGIVSAMDYYDKQSIIEETVKSYQNKFVRWLQAQ